MNRKLDFLAKYDENLTIAQLRQSAIEEEKKLAEKEQKEIQEIKNEFENTYAKYTVDECIFGKILKVISFKNFDRRDLTTEYVPTYTFEAEVLCFTERDVYRKEIRAGWCDGSFTKEELKYMTKITKKDYQDYLNKYNKLKKELKNIINK